MDDFKALLVEGLFYGQGTELHLETTEGKQIDVFDLLEPLVGRKIKFALHHIPLDGHDKNLPGGGSCKWVGDLEKCPAGHWKYPTRMLAVQMQGVLFSDPWRIEAEDGSDAGIPWKGMPGHQGRLMAVTILDIEGMTARLKGMSPEDALASLRANMGVR